MRHTTSWGVIGLTLICAVMVGAWACHAQGKGSTPEPDTSGTAGSKVAADHVVEIEIDEATLHFSKERVPPVEAKRGQSVEFRAKNSDLWILIPMGHIERKSGGDEWATAKSFISFKILEGESAAIKVADDFPDSKEKVEFGYSILSRKNNRYRYVVGNSPPRIIIPPRPPGGNG